MDKNDFKSEGALEVNDIVVPNLKDYQIARDQFSWEKELNNLIGSDEQGGINIGYLAVDRHCHSALRNHTAIKFIQKDFQSIEFTYDDLRTATNKFANVLSALGIAPGETVYTFLGRCPELYITALGALKHESVFCPLFSAFGPEPVRQRLTSGKVKVLVTTKALYEQRIKPQKDKLPTLQYVLLVDADNEHEAGVLSYADEMNKAGDQYSVPDTDPETPALLHFTSGTTGMPKGALHVHNAVLMHYVTGKYVLDFHPGDIFWCTADPGWVTGTSYGIISPLINGVTNIIDEEEFDAARWYQILEKEKVNIWYTAPTAIRRLMRMDIKPREQYNLEHLRMVLSVGEPLNPEAVKWGQQTFGVPVLDNWWQTETGGIMISNYRSQEVRPGSMGRPLPGIEAAVAQVEGGDLKLITEPNREGHLVLRKGWPSMFREYIHQEEKYNKSFAGDWYMSGDLAKIDEDGYFWFVGRADDIIKTSGHMVGPFEVESALMEHPKVAEAAVIGIPNPMIGELVKAFVVLKKGTETSEEVKRDIMGFARVKLGSAIAPKEITFIETLPKTKSGKILRRLLKARELGLPEGDTSTLEKE